MRKLDMTPIYNSLYDHLQTGDLVRSNGKLLTERELARMYGVARNTLRPVLRRLEQEGFLVRKPSLGTQVVKRCQKPIIYYLLPCPDFLEDKYTDYSGFTVRLLSKVSREIYEHGASLRLLYATDDNQYGHINIRNFEELRPESRVVVNSSWYLPLLPYFLERQVHVVYVGITTEETDQLLQNRYLDKFHFLLLDCRREAYEMYGHLRARGARQIGLVATYLSEEHPHVQGFLDACRECGGNPNLIFSMTRENQKGNENWTQKRRFFHQCLVEHPELDAVMMPEAFPLEGTLQSLPQFAFLSNFGSMPVHYESEPVLSQIPLTQAARQAVEWLLAPAWESGIDYLKPQIRMGGEDG